LVLFFKKERPCLLPCLLVALGGIAGPGTSFATPLFAQQTKQPCSACHQPGREYEGAKGLNGAGIAFMNCGKLPACFGAPPKPGPNGAPAAGPAGP